jgi:outer membrane protein assembly factor BamB
MDSPCLGGIAATDQWVFVTDQMPNQGNCLLKALDPMTGAAQCQFDLIRPADVDVSKSMDYGNSIRATPLIVDGRIFLLDAYGVLFSLNVPANVESPFDTCIHGIRLDKLVDRAKLPTWGISSTPLWFADRLVVNVCGETTTLLGLEPNTLDIKWTGEGANSGYASCVIARFGELDQIIGYDSRSLGGWNAANGRRLWTIVPECDGDYNVPTPVVVDDHRLLVVTENNGMRLYHFGTDGLPATEPVAANLDVCTDTVTPIVVRGRVYCTTGDELYCLDLEDGLRTLWRLSDAAFLRHVSLFADVAGSRLLAVAYDGELVLIDITGNTPQITSRHSPFLPHETPEMYAEPALIGNRIYLRGTNSVRCVLFPEASF